MTTSGSAKILQAFQVNTESEAFISARGSIAQIRGLWQSETVFNPGTLLKGRGRSLSAFTFSSFCAKPDRGTAVRNSLRGGGRSFARHKSFIKIAQVMGFNESAVADSLSEYYYRLTGKTPEDGPKPSIEELCGFIIRNTIGRLELPGWTVSPRGRREDEYGPA